MKGLAYFYLELLVYLLVMWRLWRVLLRHIVKFYFKVWKDLKPISWITLLLLLQVCFFGYVYYLLGWNALKALAWITLSAEERDLLIEFWSS